MKPRGRRRGNGEAWFTTAVLAEARSTVAVLESFQETLKRLMLPSAEQRYRVSAKAISRVKRPASPIRADALFAVVDRKSVV